MPPAPLTSKMGVLITWSLAFAALLLMSVLPSASALPHRTAVRIPRLGHAPLALPAALRGGTVGAVKELDDEEEEDGSCTEVEDDDYDGDLVEGGGPHKGYRAAFGVRVGSEAAAAAFNIAATATMAGLMVYSKKSLTGEGSNANPRCAAPPCFLHQH